MIYLGSDHGGYELKEHVQSYLKLKGEKVVDLGVFAVEPPADYPDIAHEVSEKVRENQGAKGILVCGSGVGMCMTANKTPGIRATLGEREYTVEMSRRHNDANMLCLGGRVITKEESEKLIDTFLATPFENDDRHKRRIAKIDKK